LKETDETSRVRMKHKTIMRWAISVRLSHLRSHREGRSVTLEEQEKKLWTGNGYFTRSKVEPWHR